MYTQLLKSTLTRSDEYNNPFTLMRGLLEDNRADQHVIVEDFNIHHSLWSDIRHLTLHTAAEGLILSIFSNECSLLISQELETFSTSRGGTTIDLTFITEGLA